MRCRHTCATDNELYYGDSTKKKDKNNNLGAILIMVKWSRTYNNDNHDTHQQKPTGTA